MHEGRTMMAQWGFYGRQKESRELARYLQLDPAECDPEQRFFVAVGIGGRRGVGKNTLLEHVVAQHGWQDRLLVVTLPAAATDLRETNARFLQALERGLDQYGMEPLLSDMPPRQPKHADDYQIARVIRHLVRKDIIVCLDEVHAILETDMPTILQVLIDNLSRCTVPAADRAPGKLVLMGSHQQKFAQLQNATAPLQDRFDVLPLMPWSIDTVMDIAQVHGWDRRPARFQALWTAYDGMPREWERFARGPNTPERLHQGWEPPSGDEAWDRAQDEIWYKEFVRHERDRIQRIPVSAGTARPISSCRTPCATPSSGWGQTATPGRL